MNQNMLALELPPLLDADEQAEVISYLGTRHDNTAKTILIKHNLRLVVHIAKTFSNAKVEMDDLFSIGAIGLIKAVNTFDVHKDVKLATYATRCIRNEILMYLRKMRKTKLETPLDEPVCRDAEGNELTWADVMGTYENEGYQGIKASVERELLMEAIEALDEKDKAIIKMRFGIGTAGNRGFTQHEMAQLLGISQSYLSRLEKRILNQLKKKLLEKGF